MLTALSTCLAVSIFPGTWRTSNSARLCERTLSLHSCIAYMQPQATCGSEPWKVAAHAGMCSEGKTHPGLGKEWFFFISMAWWNNHSLYISSILLKLISLIFLTWLLKNYKVYTWLTSYFYWAALLQSLEHQAVPSLWECHTRSPAWHPLPLPVTANPAAFQKSCQSASQSQTLVLPSVVFRSACSRLGPDITCSLDVILPLVYNKNII